jgi:hypothetical protein
MPLDKPFAESLDLLGYWAAVPTSLPDGVEAPSEVQSLVEHCRAFCATSDAGFTDVNGLILKTLRQVSDLSQHPIAPSMKESVRFFAVGARRYLLSNRQGANTPTHVALSSGLFWRTFHEQLVKGGVLSTSDDWRSYLAPALAFLNPRAHLSSHFGNASGDYYCRKDPKKTDHFDIFMDGLGITAIGPSAGRALALHEMMHAVLTWQMHEELFSLCQVKSDSREAGEVGMRANRWEDIRANVAGSFLYRAIGSQDVHSLYKGWMLACAKTVEKNPSIPAECWMLGMAHGIQYPQLPFKPSAEAVAWLEKNKRHLSALMGEMTIPLDKEGAFNLRVQQRNRGIHARTAAGAILALMQSLADKDPSVPPNGKSPGEESTAQKSQPSSSKSEPGNGGGSGDQTEQPKDKSQQKGAGKGNDRGVAGQGQSDPNSAKGRGDEPHKDDAETTRSEGGGGASHEDGQKPNSQEGKGVASGEEGDRSCKSKAANGPSISRPSSSGGECSTDSRQDAGSRIPSRGDPLDQTPQPIGGQLSADPMSHKQRDVFEQLKRECNPTVEAAPDGTDIVCGNGIRILMYANQEPSRLKELDPYRNEIATAARRFESLRKNAEELARKRTTAVSRGQSLHLKGLTNHLFVNREDIRIFSKRPQALIANNAIFAIIIDASGSMARVQRGTTRIKAVTTIAASTLLAIEKAGYRTILGAFSSDGSLIYGPDESLAVKRRKLGDLLKAADATNLAGFLDPKRKGDGKDTCATHATLSAVAGLNASSSHKPGTFHVMLFTDGEFNRGQRLAKDLIGQLPHTTWTTYCHPQLSVSAQHLLGNERVILVPDLGPSFLNTIVDGFFSCLTKAGGVAPAHALRRHFSETKTAAVEMVRKHPLINVWSGRGASRVR